MLRFKKGRISRTQYMIMALLLVAPYLGFKTGTSYAGVLLSERVVLGTSEPSVNTSHNFSFNIATSGNVGTIQFQYCDNSPYFDAPCDAAIGLDTSAAALTSQVGTAGFAVDPLTDTNNIFITRPSSAVTAGGAIGIDFDNIINPSPERYSVYVRIKTYASNDGTGPVIDDGALVFSTSGQLNTAGFVPPYLTFCAAIFVSADCVNVNGFTLDLGELSPNQTSSGASQFAVSTNYPLGYIVFISGTTMTSGNNIIPALTTPAASQAGVAQFGLNLRDNSTPNVGSDQVGSGTGVVEPSYGLANQYKFVTGEAIARSPLPSEPNIFTASYVVNVPESQAPGVYNTTLQYIATAQF